ncbi:MAG: Mur ligase family protein, partial [Wenzhouxiangellaceae bacterium]
LIGHATIGVLTRLFPEHLDWHGSVEAYYAAKLRLAGMRDGRPLLIQSSDPVLSSACHSLAGVVLANRSDGIHARTEGIFRRDTCLLSAADSPLPGRHNLDNIALALSVLDLIGVDVGHSGPALRRFSPLPHRLQRLADVAGRSWVNDSISTTPYATRAALEACGVAAVLIAGGFERGADWQPVVEACRTRPLAGLVALPDNGGR